MKILVAEDGIAPTHQPSYAGKATSLTLPCCRSFPAATFWGNYMKSTRVPDLNRLCTAMRCYRLWDVTCPSGPVRGRCV